MRAPRSPVPPLSALLAAVTLVAAAPAPAQASQPSAQPSRASARPARVAKIRMVRFAPSGAPELALLDQEIAADPDLSAAFTALFQVESHALGEAKDLELHQRLGSPYRGAAPGIALVDRAGTTLSVVDVANWKSDGRWDRARIRAFVDFWMQPPAKSDRLAACKQKYGLIYSPEADAKAELAQALALAKQENKHVLVKVGGNWCPWCYFLHDELETQPNLKKLVDSSYVLLRVNHDPRGVSNDDLLARLDNPQRFGFPVLVVLDADGKRLHTQDTGLLEVGDHHDPRQVEQFLKGWTPQALLPRTAR